MELDDKRKAADLAYCSLHRDQAHAKKPSWNRCVDSVVEMVAFGRQSGHDIADVSLDLYRHGRKGVPGVWKPVFEIHRLATHEWDDGGGNNKRAVREVQRRRRELMESMVR